MDASLAINLANLRKRTFEKSLQKLDEGGKIKTPALNVTNALLSRPKALSANQVNTGFLQNQNRFHPAV